MVAAQEFTVSFIATSFPRDTLNVNVYNEHVLIGQVLEPLFTLGEDGLVTGDVAKSWSFNKNGDELLVILRKDLFFSNGKQVDSEDVKFSLERHIKSPQSQSHAYLNVVKFIEILSKIKLKIKLKKPFVPVLLALSRDQLGILPKNWKFDLNSIEIGRASCRERVSSPV